MEKEDVLKML